MTWSYSDTLVNTRDKVRLQIGDVLSSDPQLSDEALDWYLSLHGNNVLRTSIAACDALIARYAREVDRNIGDASLREGDRHLHYQRLARHLRGTLAMQATPVAGGITKSSRDTREDNTDRIPPFFTRERFNAGDPALVDSSAEDA